MDAFVQRSPRLLFRRDALLLSRGLDALRALVAEHGGRVLDESQAAEPLAGADGARELLLVVPDGAADGDGAAAAELRAARLRFPRARVVAAEWVRACVAQSKRLPTRAFEAAAEAEPPAKRARTAADLLVGAPAAVGREERPQPHFRPWQSLDGGSLLVLDARARADKDEHEAAKSKNVKVAAFDLDGTLIITKSGKRFAQNDGDWKWFHPTRVTEKLAELVADGFDLVLFSNQNGVEKGKVTAAEVQRKVSTIVKKLDLPMLVFLATRDDMNRKPRVNAWTKMAEILKSEGEVDKSSSFYCGDAAGRPKIAGRNKDFAATDYKFALNVGVSFFTPEALFLASKQRVHTHPDTWEIGFDPRSIPIGNGPLLNPAASDLTREHQEMVLLAGSPASGKSHFAASCFSSYVVVNQDELRTVANCKKVCLEALANKKSVVIDGTNRSKPTRKEWIDIAQSHNLPIRCFEMDVPKTVTMYLNVFRSLTTSKKIPDVAIHGFYKNYTAPEVSEGFEEIVKVSFQLDKASLSDESFRLIRSFL